MNVRDADKFMGSLGLEVYRVGGSVRDELLGRKPKDADYVVRGASVDDLRRKVVRADKHVKASTLKLRDGRVVGVRADVRGLGLLEIALPRTEVSTGPGHGDFMIVTDPSLPLKSDAERRDFTINALYFDLESKEILDPLGTGRFDLSEGYLRITHDASFRDDPLRILRAARFLSQLPPKFNLARRTRAHMTYHADAVTGLTEKGVSGTAWDELRKLLEARRPSKGLRALRDTGALAVFLPELAPMIGFEQESRYHDMTTDEHTFTALEAAAGFHCALRVRLALLFHDAGKPESAWTGEDGRLHYYAKNGFEDHEVVSARLAREAFQRLNVPRRLRNDALTLIHRHMVPLSGRVKAAKVRRWRAELGDDLLADLLKHRLCDVMGKGVIDGDAVQKIAKMEEIRSDAARRGVPATPRDLPISGNDVRELGLDGPAIGQVLRGLLHEVVSQPDLNNREWLLSRAQTLARKHV
jgi:tRNA nucleotidyltransferase (CCA-adding enzyme)